MMGWAILVTYHDKPFEGRTLFRLKGHNLVPLSYKFTKEELYKTNKAAAPIISRYMFGVNPNTVSYETVSIEDDGLYHKK